MIKRQHTNQEGLNWLQFAGDRRIVVLDVDEVVMHHSTHLAEFLDQRGIRISRFVHELEGQLRYRENGAVVDGETMDRLLDSAFRYFCRIQTPVEGAIETIRRISESSDVLFLTNVPEHSFEDRKLRLEELGLKHQVVRNVGGKGRYVFSLVEKYGNVVIFVDDSEKQILNVRKHVPSVFSIHATFIEEISRTAQAFSNADARVRNWRELEKVIFQLF